MATGTDSDLGGDFERELAALLAAHDSTEGADRQPSLTRWPLAPLGDDADGEGWT